MHTGPWKRRGRSDELGDKNRLICCLIHAVITKATEKCSTSSPTDNHNHKRRSQPIFRLVFGDNHHPCIVCQVRDLWLDPHDQEIARKGALVWYWARPHDPFVYNCLQQSHRSLLQRQFVVVESAQRKERAASSNCTAWPLKGSRLNKNETTHCSLIVVTESLPCAAKFVLMDVDLQKLQKNRQNNKSAKYLVQYRKFVFLKANNLLFGA